MSFGLQLELKDQASPAYAWVVRNLRRPDLRKVMGRAIGGGLRKHFSKLDRERPNKLGGRRTHFWGQVRRSVQQPELVGGDGVKVSIPHVGAAQRYFGGEIEASPGKKLTIPVHPEAHGHRAREFDLDPIYFADGTGILVRKNDASPNAIGEVFYRLVQRVRQEKDETVLPPEGELEETALQAGSEYLSSLGAKGSA